MSTEVTWPDGKPFAITFHEGRPGMDIGPCLYLLDDYSIHSGVIFRNTETFPDGALITTNPAGGFHEKFEIPLRRVIGWAFAGPQLS